MALFNISDIQYNDYQWTAYPNDNPKVTGKPDSTKFNRHEGYEVLYLINLWLKNGTLKMLQVV
jgi:hypothetical protein